LQAFSAWGCFQADVPSAVIQSCCSRRAAITVFKALADNGAFVGVPTFFLIVQCMFHALAFLEQS
jgi:hypothetical protein